MKAPKKMNTSSRTGPTAHPFSTAQAANAIKSLRGRNTSRNGTTFSSRTGKSS